MAMSLNYFYFLLYSVRFLFLMHLVERLELHSSHGNIGVKIS